MFALDYLQGWTEQAWFLPSAMTGYQQMTGTWGSLEMLPVGGVDGAIAEPVGGAAIADLGGDMGGD